MAALLPPWAFLLLLLLPLFENGSSSAAAAAAMQAQELSALYDVVGSLLDYPTWAEAHPHPCTDTPWPGVQCELINRNGIQDPSLHVTRLHVGPDIAAPPCKPTAHLSPSLLRLPFLKTLSLFSCFLSPSSNVSLTPTLFTNSSSLEQLVLKSNPALVGQIPKSLSNLKNLRVLSLSQNNLHGPIPEELGGLAKLQQLDLSYNHLTGEIPKGIGRLTSLAIFDVSWNELEGQLPASLGQLSSLQKLDFSSNSLSATIPAEFGKLNKLVLLDLSCNSLTGPIPEALTGLESLEYFLAESNPVGTTIPTFLGSLEKLAVVGLSGCGLLGPIPTCLGSLRDLTALALDRNRLNGSVPASLGALPKLGQLNLSQNELSGEIEFDQDFVSRLGNRLDVRDNKGLCAKFQKLSLTLEAPPCLDSKSASSSAAGDNLRKNSSAGQASMMMGPHSSSLSCSVCAERAVPVVGVCSLGVQIFLTFIFS